MYTDTIDSAITPSSQVIDKIKKRKGVQDFMSNPKGIRHSKQAPS